MKKVLLSLVAFVFATACAVAQGSLLATLSHEGNITTFYGAQAWRQAHDAAVHGDVITLSSGTFIATDITKAVTVRGAGMGIDTAAVTEPTVISGDFKINIADSVTSRLTLEGIYSNHTVRYEKVKNPLFLKCRFKDVTSYGYGSILKDANFIHCRVATRLYLGGNCSTSCISSVINRPENLEDGSSSFDFQNCVLVNFDTNSYSSYKNCIIIPRLSYSKISSNCTAYNCISLRYSALFDNMTNSTNRFVEDLAAVFRTYQAEDLEKADNETFRLTETARAQYLGMDGTEVGIYGGVLPYDPVPSNLQITKCNVAAKSTADGKLSVDIEVKSAE